MGQISESAFTSYEDADYETITPGPFALYTVSLDSLQPTQLNVGFQEVDKKADGFDEDTNAAQLNAALLTDIEPVVIGPGGVLYLTDGHHTFVALTESAYGATNPTVYVNVIANYSNLTEAEFITTMEQENLLYPVNDGTLETVSTITGAPLATSLEDLTSDVYRGLEYAILKNKSSKLFTNANNITGATGAAIPGLDKTAAFYSDFIWADAYRGANGGLGLPSLSPGDVALATDWNLNPNSETTLPGIGTIAVSQLPGFILTGNITISGAITDATLANGVLDGSKTGSFDESTSFASFAGLRVLNLGPVEIGSNATGFVMQLGADSGYSVTLSGNNSYTGGTTFLAGTLIITSDASLGAAAGTAPINTASIAASVEADNGIIFDSLTEGNATLQFGATATPGVNSFTENRAIVVDGEAANLNLNGNTITLTGPVISAGAISEGISNQSGEADLTVEDNSSAANGTLILAPAAAGQNADFYGNWIVTSGTLNVSSDAALGNTAGPAYTIGQIELNGGVFQAGANFSSVRSLQVASGSAYDTNGYTTSFAGSVTDVQRTLQVINSSTAAAGAVTFGTLVVGATATLNVIGGSQGTSVTLADGIARSGAATLILDPGTGALGTSETVFDDSFGAGASSTVTDGIVAPWIVVFDSTTANPTPANPYSFVTYGSATGYTATAGNSTNILTSTAQSVVTQSSNASAGANLAAYALSLQAGKSIALNGFSLTLGGSATDEAGLILNGGASITGGTLATGQSELVMWLAGQSSAQNTISSTITGTGGLTIAGGLQSTSPGISSSAASGSGTVNLNTAAAETGAVTIDSGVLTLNAVNALFSSLPGVYLEDTKKSPSPAVLNITKNNQFTALQSAGSNSAINLSAGAVLTIGDTTNNLSSVLSSTIKETGTATAGAITKAGSGLLDLSGSGGITLISGSTVLVKGGALRIANGVFSASATNAITISAGAELQYAGNGGSKFNDPISGAGIFHLLAGTVQLTGANSYTGGTVIETGAVLDVTTANLPAGGNITDAGGEVVFDQTTSGAFGGVISDGEQAGGPNDPDALAATADAGMESGTLIKDDSTSDKAGNVTLTAQQQYTGYTYIEAGTLTLGAVNTVEDSAGVVLGRVGGGATAQLALAANNQLAGLSDSAANTDTVLLNGNVLSLDNAAGTSAQFGGTILDGSGPGSVVLNGGGTEILAGTNGFSGGITLDSGTLVLDAVGAAGTGVISFGSGDPPVLAFAIADAPTNSIAGLVSGDSIDITDLAASSITSQMFNTLTDVLTIDYNGDGGTPLALTFSGSFMNDPFSFAANGNGTALTDDNPCFAAGTRIQAALGEIAVEDLKIGDLLKTQGSGLQRIKWIGRRDYDGRFIAGNKDILPVCVKRHAIAPNIPARDLWVSPGHAICIDGALIHAFRLVNGVSIIQAGQVASLSYYHIEMENHEVVFANDCPAETFMDEAFRRQFQNADEYRALYPGEAAPRLPCLPQLRGGFALHDIRQRLNMRAGIAAPARPRGRLRGFVDIVGPKICAGWAQDANNPEEPVCLDIFVDGEAVARVLANYFRADLRKAGLGSGCHAFSAALPAGNIGWLDVRRASDGAELAWSDAALSAEAA